MNLKSITQEVCTISKEVGIFILEECKKFNVSDIEIKSQNSLVTYVDKTAEKMIVNFLGKLIPESGFIAEEGTSVKKGDVYNWVIDPLDGTTNFIHAIPCYCVSIGLLKNDELIVGVIYEPNRDEMFYAWKNGGAYLNENSISVSKTNKLSDSLLATGFPYYDYRRLEAYMDILKWLMHNSRGVRRIGSAAIDLAYVACGRFEAFYEYSLNPWDVAAGALIVKEAGGSVTDFQGGKNYLFGSEIIASNKYMEAELLDKIKGSF
ncbi:MAG: inositol monophosphatase family protein [Flavobacteriales bacterium]|nr:inositol monophosphatase family protein [Flavobacteriales bacterium]